MNAGARPALNRIDAADRKRSPAGICKQHRVMSVGGGAFPTQSFTGRNRLHGVSTKTFGRVG